MEDAIPEDVCRDFMRNVCMRGQKCRFKHPDRPGSNEDDSNELVLRGPEDNKPEGLQDKVLFCHDFQNNRCSRSSCKFIHCPKDVELEYQSSGYLPPLVRDQVISKGIAADFPAVSGGVPACKDFLKGKCTRRTRCKFRHLGPREYDLEMSGAQFNPACVPNNTFFEEEDLFERRGPNERKRRMMEVGAGMEVGPPPMQAFFMVQEENLQLKARVMELEKKVSDLMATNEFLLDQNAQLRIGGAGPPQGARPQPMYGRLM